MLTRILWLQQENCRQQLATAANGQTLIPKDQPTGNSAGTLQLDADKTDLRRLGVWPAQCSKAAALGCFIVLAHAMQAVHQGEPPQRAQHVVLGFPLNPAFAASISL